MGSSSSITGYFSCNTFFISPLLLKHYIAPLNPYWVHHFYKDKLENLGPWSLPLALLNTPMNVTIPPRSRKGGLWSQLRILFHKVMVTWHCTNKCFMDSSSCWHTLHVLETLIFHLLNLSTVASFFMQHKPHYENCLRSSCIIEH